MKKDINGIWLNDKNEPIKWQNAYEGDIIAPYVNFLGDVDKWPKYQKWQFADGMMLEIKFEGYGESDNGLDMDNPNYEEFYEFYFRILSIRKKSKNCKWKKGENAFVNYKNFPVKWEGLKKEDNKKQS